MQVKKDQVRDAIIDSARVLFQDKGYAGTSMPDIGRGAAVAPSTIYVYFASKLDILYAVYEPWMIERLTALKPKIQRQRSPQSRLRCIVEALWRDIPTFDNGFANNLIQAVSLASHDEGYNNDLLRRCEIIVADLLNLAFAPAQLFEDASRLAHILIMAFDGFVVRHHVAGARGDMDAIIDTMTMLLLASAPPTALRRKA